MLVKEPVRKEDQYTDLREAERKKWMDMKGFRFASNPKDRQKEAAYNNSFLSSDPTALCFGTNPIKDLRRNDISKHLHGDIRYRARNSVERVYDTLSQANVSGKSPVQLINESQIKERLEKSGQHMLDNLQDARDNVTPSGKSNSPSQNVSVQRGLYDDEFGDGTARGSMSTKLREIIQGTRP